MSPQEDAPPPLVAGDTVEVTGTGEPDTIGTVLRDAGDATFVVQLQDGRTTVLHEQHLCWRAPLPEERPAGLNYSIVGTWDNWQCREMSWNSSLWCLEYVVTIGEEGTESFKFVMDEDWDMCVHPDCSDANPHTPHFLQGPDEQGMREEWSIGVHPDDEAAEGKQYRVRLFLSPDGLPEAVTWEPLPRRVTWEPPFKEEGAKGERGARAALSAAASVEDSPRRQPPQREAPVALSSAADVEKQGRTRPATWMERMARPRDEIAAEHQEAREPVPEHQEARTPVSMRPGGEIAAEHQEARKRVSTRPGDESAAEHQEAREPVPAQEARQPVPEQETGTGDDVTSRLLPAEEARQPKQEARVPLSEQARKPVSEQEAGTEDDVISWILPAKEARKPVSKQAKERAKQQFHEELFKQKKGGVEQYWSKHAYEHELAKQKSRERHEREAEAKEAEARLRGRVQRATRMPQEAEARRPLPEREAKTQEQGPPRRSVQIAKMVPPHDPARKGRSGWETWMEAADTDLIFPQGDHDEQLTTYYQGDTSAETTEKVAENLRRYRQEIRENTRTATDVKYSRKELARDGGDCMECGNCLGKVIDSLVCCNECWDQWGELRQKGWDPSVLCSGITAGSRAESLAADGSFSRKMARVYIMGQYPSKFQS